MRLQLFLLLNMVCLSCAKIKVKNGLTDENLKGKVKSIIVVYYFSDDSSIDKKEAHLEKLLDKYQNNILRYDENGNLINVSYFFDSLITITNYQYNSHGKIKLQEDYDAKGILESRTTFQYDKDNNVTEGIEKYVNGKTLALLKYMHNNLIERKLIGDKVKQIVTYKYDNNNRKIEERVFNEANQLFAIRYYKYDTDGNLAENDDSLAHGPHIRNIFKYNNFDKNGNWQTKITLQYDCLNEDDQTVTERQNSTEYTRRQIEYY